ncbi:MAG: ATP synthase F1 subunit epsilon [Clostridiales bacterium]|nr:ATP synthase F1 subunit epsilon [Clostridiales bacterium]
MANKLHLRVVTPTGQFYDGSCDMVIMKTIDGDTGVLYGHQPLTTILDLGCLRILDEGSEKKSTLMGGFAKVNSEGLTIISDAAEWPGDIDIERAEKSRQRATERLEGTSKGTSEVDHSRAEAALKRAVLRIDIAGVEK